MNLTGPSLHQHILQANDDIAASLRDLYEKYEEAKRRSKDKNLSTEERLEQYRYRVRMIRRCGEILAPYHNKGKYKDARINKSKLCAMAGMGQDEQIYATQIARIPIEQLEALLSLPSPPAFTTLTMLSREMVTRSPRGNIMHSGPKINISADKSIEQAFRHAMSKTMNSQELAATLNVGLIAARRIRDLILLSDRAAELPKSDARKVADALAVLNATRQLKPWANDIQPIAFRVLIHDGKGEKFKHAISIISEVAAAGHGLVIPFLTLSEAANYMATVNDAIGALVRLRDKIRETR